MRSCLGSRRLSSVEVGMRAPVLLFGVCFVSHLELGFFDQTECVCDLSHVGGHS